MLYIVRHLVGLKMEFISRKYLNEMCLISNININYYFAAS